MPRKELVVPSEVPMTVALPRVTCGLDAACVEGPDSAARQYVTSKARYKNAVHIMRYVGRDTMYGSGSQAAGGVDT